MGANTLTDDGVEKIIGELTTWVEDNVGFPIWENDDKYESFTNLIWDLIGDYSNGYKNYN